MTFYEYMMKKHKGENTPKGDLAFDMKCDSKHFPRNDSKNLWEWQKIINQYFMNHFACEACLKTFDECWKEYVTHEKTISSRRN